MKWGLVVLVATFVLALTVSATATAHRYSRGCNTSACEKRVCTAKSCKFRVASRARAREASAFPPISAADRAWLNKVGGCEADSSGGYALYTTGNGFYFRYQFTAGSWAGAGGRLVNGMPWGLHSKLPSSREQDHRALVVRQQQGTGAWPVCG
jgi:hypothetical protein